MIVFFQCVAEAVAEKGVRGAIEAAVPGSGWMFDIAKATWEKYRQRCKEAKQREEIQKLAAASFEEAKKAAAEAVKEYAAKQPEIVPTLEVFLAQIPGSIRQSLKRADDPTGTTVSATFALRGPEDVAKLLPPALPRFKPGDPLPGKAGWLLEKQLGIGGFGEVWLARKSGYESLLGAVKFCRSLDTRDRDLLHESKVIDQLLKHGDHPNIVKLMDVHLEGDAPWLMYEYVEGGDLTDLIHQWSALPPSDRQQKALAALQELAAAIGHFHRLDPAIVHRDLKPANILRDKSGRLRITDFGISGIAAKHMIENETRGVTTRAGRLQSYLYGSYTPLYASPQQKDGAAPDPRDDVHALGVIGYQMLTGQVGRGVGADFAEDLKDAGVPMTFVGLLGRSAAVKAERRFDDAAFLSAELAGCMISTDAKEMAGKRFFQAAAGMGQCYPEPQKKEGLNGAVETVEDLTDGVRRDRDLKAPHGKRSSAGYIFLIIRSILGAVGGLGVALIGIVGFSELILQKFYPIPNGLDPNDSVAWKAWMTTRPTGAFILVLLMNVTGSFVGGFASALIASWGRTIHAGLIGACVLLMTIMSYQIVPGAHPDWVILPSYVLPIPVSILAGLLVGRLRARGARIAVQPSPPTLLPPPAHSHRDPHVCPYCRASGVAKVRGLHGIGEAILGTFLTCLCIFPGIIYYVCMEAIPLCSKCGRRVWR